MRERPPPIVHDRCLCYGIPLQPGIDLRIVAPRWNERRDIRFPFDRMGPCRRAPRPPASRLRNRCRRPAAGESRLEQGSSGRSRTKRWLVRFPRAMPVAIFFLIAAITIFSVFTIERGEDARASAQLRSRAVAIASALERRANASSAICAPAPR